MIAYKNKEPFQFSFGDVFVDRNTGHVYAPARLNPRNRLELLRITLDGNSAPSFEGISIDLGDVPSYFHVIDTKEPFSSKKSKKLEDILKELELPDINKIQLENISFNDDIIEMDDEKIKKLIDEYNKQKLLISYLLKIVNHTYKDNHANKSESEPSAESSVDASKYYPKFVDIAETREFKSPAKSKKVNTARSATTFTNSSGTTLVVEDFSNSYITTAELDVRYGQTPISAEESTFGSDPTDGPAEF